DRARAIDVTESLLETYPDLDGVFSVSADGAPAAAVVVEEQGVEDEIVVGGFDDLSDTLEAIENGTVDFAVVQRVYAMGWLSVERLLDLMEGEEIDSQYDTGVVIVTRDNYDTYSDEIMEEFAEED
ncbi:MAG: sugar ABC transporter substrate-binding protein, partial [Spirochaetaceae bacterium]